MSVHKPKFTIDVGITDGGTHARVESIDAVNATTGATLDSRTVGQAKGDTNTNDQFRNGTYLVWLVRGHVRFTVTNLNSNAVVSGIFFD